MNTNLMVCSDWWLAGINQGMSQVQELHIYGRNVTVFGLDGVTVSGADRA